MQCMLANQQGLCRAMEACIHDQTVLKQQSCHLNEMLLRPALLSEPG